MPLSQHLQPDTSDARLARVWANVKGRLQDAPPGRRWARLAVAAGALATVALAVALAVRHGDAPGSALESAVLDTAGDTLGVTLLDGSQLTLDSKTHVQIASGS